MGRIWLLLLVPACFNPSYNRPACGPADDCPGALVCVQGICEPPGAGSDASTSDADIDAPVGSAPDACTTFSRQLNTCGLPLMTDLSIAQTATFNTSTRELRVGGLLTATVSATVIVNGQTVDAILVHDLTIASGVTLRAVGNQPAGAPPFAVIAGRTVTLEDGAAIDVSDGGAGAISTCATSPANGQNSLTDGGGGGGGGGAYGGGGGDGGAGNLGGTAVFGGRGGASVALSSVLEGGCSGARGGVGTGGHFGAPGRGGGVIFIVAASGIRLGTDAVLQAGGGGGGGAGRTDNPNTGEGGGGGGGSGGLIVLEAPQILASNARIVANGGGGGEGSSLTEAGNNGSPGLTITGSAPGGNSGAVDGTDGGQGGARTTKSGANVTTAQTGGGGGGGGGVGYISIMSRGEQLGVNVSPIPIVQP